MSNRASVRTLYGICYASGSADAAKFQDYEMENVEGSPAWLACNRGKSSEQVEAVAFGHYDRPGFALALAGTIGYGVMWEPVHVCEPYMTEELKIQVDALRSFCRAHGLTWSRPKMWAVPYYG